MAEVFFDNPPTLSGQEKDQLVQLQRYLSAMSDKLNTALMSISIEQMAPETKKVIIADQQQETKQNYDTLKSMIIKTAEIVRHEMSVIQIQLDDQYQALSSQFGEYDRNLTNNITITAEGILQDYHYEERISGLESDSTSINTFKTNLNQYIFSGLIDDVNKRYGIAIGENVTQYAADGTPSLNTNNKMATFTMDKLSFWRGTTELAYFSDEVFHINQGEIMQSLKIGNHTWRVLTNGAMALVSG